jgi:hypothetical protein
MRKRQTDVTAIRLVLKDAVGKWPATFFLVQTMLIAGSAMTITARTVMTCSQGLVRTASGLRRKLEERFVIARKTGVVGRSLVNIACTPAAPSAVTTA